MKKLGTCIRPGCNNESSARGLCRGCYHAAKAAVKKGWVTWQKLEEEGKLLPKRQGKSCLAWPWLMDWCKDPVVQRQIAMGPIPPERPEKKPRAPYGSLQKKKRGAYGPRKARDAETPEPSPFALARPTQ